jgi:superfamily II DNA or RNA helicase
LRFFQYRVKVDYDGKPIDDPIKATRVNLHQNKNVYKHAASLINHAVTVKNKRVLVQVDTLDQFKYLLDGGLSVEARFAHGGVTKDNKATVPEAHWKSDPMDLVEKFDNGEFPVLVGTSAIGTGVDVKRCNVIINLVGLSSEIEITQNIGRGTRLFPGKTECVYIDYDVIENNAEDGRLWVLSRHAAKRREIFNSIYGECKILEVK